MPTPTLLTLRSDLLSVANSQRTESLKRFFKTGPGEYAEGDRFIGVTVPQVRQIAKTHAKISLKDVRMLLKSPIHEERLAALLIMVLRFRKGTDVERERLFKLYLANTRFINNWDLVDVSAGHVVGGYLVDKSKAILHRLAKSQLLWERRISIIATSRFISLGNFAPTLAISRILLEDEHDLIHKAVGWMLREVGKRDQRVEESFLKTHYQKMPRTMLRYAIERLPEARRQAYLKGAI